MAVPLLFLPRAARAATATPIVGTANGRLAGAMVGGVCVFRGIPYGQGVSGRGRFRPASPVTPWAGVRDATVPGPPSIQPAGRTFGIGEPAPAEECLTLTVWTPATDAAKRPVMVYSHGGGFTTGSAASVIQDGAALARLYDVVVVATNHRLGLLGYLYLDELAGGDLSGTGTNGLSDIVQGLAWVKTNIARFGGDPSNVMIFGESGGGAKTSCLYGMPSAAPYFNKASIESGPGIRMTEKDAARRTTAMVLNELGIAPADWRRLHDVPAQTLLAVQLKIVGLPNADALSGDRRGFGASSLGFSPVVDGVGLLRHPFDPDAPAISRDKPLIVGHNRDEYAFFANAAGDAAAFTLDEAGLRARLGKEMPGRVDDVLRVYRAGRLGATPSDLYIAIRSARFAGVGSTVIADRKAAQGSAPVFAYRFDYQLERTALDTGRPLGAMHALEIAFKFDNVDNVGMRGQGNFAGNRPERRAAGRAMSAFWTSFARSGVPRASGQPEWRPYELDRRATMLIDSHCRLVDDPNASERRFWTEQP